jgi:hypothetical protein
MFAPCWDLFFFHFIITHGPIVFDSWSNWPLSQGISLVMPQPWLEAQGQNRDTSPLKEEANVLNDIH